MSRRRLTTAPVRLTGAVHPQQISSLLAVDVLAKRAVARGVPISVEVTTIAGDAATQYAVSRAVTREGEDKDALGRESFVERADRLGVSAFGDLNRLLVALDFDDAVVQRSSDDRQRAASEESSQRAARVAFVRLFEDGLLSRTDAVLDTCPTCETVVDDADIDVVETEVDQVRLGLVLDGGHLEIDVSEPELIVGAVAVAVPVDNVPAENEVYVPLVDRDLPIVPVTGLASAALVVPGHYQWCYEVARQLDLAIVEVIDGDGVIRHPGPLDSMTRYAARAAAIEALVAENFVTAHFNETRTTRRCHRCASVVVALRGRHWILSLGSLVDQVLHAIEAGDISFSPDAAVDRLREAAARSTSWVVSQQLWAGLPIPVYSCLDCGQTTVAVDIPDSCPTCMGTLQPDTDTLDARFVSAVAPIAMLGWPQSFDHEVAGRTTLAVGRLGLDNWALPMAALGLRLAGKSPFSGVTVHSFVVGAPEPGQRRTIEFVDQVDRVGPRVARAGLLLGDLDIERATEAVAVIDAPVIGDLDAGTLVEQYDRAVTALDAGAALVLVLNAAREGVTAETTEVLSDLARPLLGTRSQERE